MRAFRALPVEDKLRWVEELAMFLRMAQRIDDRGVDDRAAVSEKMKRPD